MRDAIVQFKTHSGMKKEAMKRAKAMGIDLTAVLNMLLYQFIEAKNVRLSFGDEEPTSHLLKIMKDHKQDIKKGDYVSFEDPRQALDFLQKRR